MAQIALTKINKIQYPDGLHEIEDINAVHVDTEDTITGSKTFNAEITTNENLNINNKIILSNITYGIDLPETGVEGQIFCKLKLDSGER